MEAEIIKKLERGIFRITQGTGTAVSERCGFYFKLLKPLNEFMYEDLMEKYKKALQFRDNKLKKAL